MITLPLAPYINSSQVAVTPDGAAFIHGAGNSCVLVLPGDLERLIEAARIAIAFRDAD